MVNNITLYPNWTIEKSVLIVYKVKDLKHLVRLLGSKKKRKELENLKNYNRVQIIKNKDLDILSSYINTTLSVKTHK